MWSIVKNKWYLLLFGKSQINISNFTRKDYIFILKGLMHNHDLT